MTEQPQRVTLSETRCSSLRILIKQQVHVGLAASVITSVTFVKTVDCATAGACTKTVACSTAGACAKTVAFAKVVPFAKTVPFAKVVPCANQGAGKKPSSERSDRIRHLGSQCSDLFVTFTGKDWITTHLSLQQITRVLVSAGGGPSSTHIL